MTVDQPRPEVVQAVMDAILEANPDRLAQLTSVTPAERERAENGIVELLTATEEDRDRQLEVWQILAETEFGSRGLSWGEIWDELSDAQRDALVDLYDVLPEGLLPLVDAYREGRT